jgi:NAD(P)H-dependent FMN reductase
VTPRILLIVGTDREGRFSEKVARWLDDRLGGREDLELATVDLREHPIAFYDQAEPPAYGRRNYPPDVSAWAAEVERADGFIVVTAEYNHGYPAVLKNAFDGVFPEFNRKPVAFVGYGNVGGARAIEQLRLVAIELELAPLRHAVHILPDVMRPARAADAPVDPELFASLDGRLDTLVTDLLWWTNALAQARTSA